MTTKRKIPLKKKKNKDLSHFDYYINEFWAIQKECKDFKLIKKEKSILSWIIRVMLLIASLCFFDYFNYNTQIDKTLYIGTKWEKLSWNEKHDILCAKTKKFRGKKDGI